MLGVLLTLILLFTPNPAIGATYQPRLSNRPGALSQEQAFIIRALCCAYALKWQTKPAFIMAVAHVESRTKKLEFRDWQTGRYYQPMGIQYEQYGKFARMGMPIDTLRGNIEVGARAFRGIQTLAEFKKRLKTYNCSFDSSYWSQICKAVDLYEATGLMGFGYGRN